MTNTLKFQNSPRPMDCYKSRLRVALVLALSSLFFTGCASMKTARHKGISDVPTPVPAEGYKPSSEYGNVALDSNARVDKWINYFTGRGRRHMHVYLERSARYIPMMKATFRERGMPEELVYVAMIESGFSSSAHSHASAVGYWQFIRDTGKRYSLRIDDNVDERRDPILSTQAAATYLDALYSIFGDWHLALAGYNAGERRILNAVMKHRTRDFWDLTSKRRVLAQETMDYIPKYIAAVRIGSDPAKYGFHNISHEEAFAFESVVIEKPISLDKLATEIGVTYEDLKRMNPRYRSDYVPVYNDRVNAVRVPAGKKDIAVAALGKVASDKPLRYVASFEWHRVRKGETLSHIARRYRTSVSRIRDMNNLNRRSLLRIGQRLKVPYGNVAKSQSKSKPRSTATSEPSAKTYRVKRGDTLSGIAAQHGTSIAELRRLNNLSSRSVLRAGTNLKVKDTNTSTARNSKSRNTASSRVASNSRVHVVRRGENLSVIARKYDVTIAEIARENRLQNKSTLFVGSKLVIPD